MFERADPHWRNYPRGRNYRLLVSSRIEAATAVLARPPTSRVGDRRWGRSGAGNSEPASRQTARVFARVPKLAVAAAVRGRCREVESGARNVDNILTNTLLPQISQRLLAQMAERQKIDRVNITVGSGGEFVYE